MVYYDSFNPLCSPYVWYVIVHKLFTRITTDRYCWWQYNLITLVELEWLYSHYCCCHYYINLETTEALDNWLKKMMETSLCTYRVSRGGHKPVGKRLLCKHEMHCQHSRGLMLRGLLRMTFKPEMMDVRESSRGAPTLLRFYWLLFVDARLA